MIGGALEVVDMIRVPTTSKLNRHTRLLETQTSNFLLVCRHLPQTLLTTGHISKTRSGAPGDVYATCKNLGDVGKEYEKGIVFLFFFFFFFFWDGLFVFGFYFF